MVEYFQTSCSTSGIEWTIPPNKLGTQNEKRLHFGIENQLKQKPKQPKSKTSSKQAVGTRATSSGGVKSPPCSGRQWLFRIIALVVIPLVLLSTIEAGLRLVGYGFDPSLFKVIKIGDRTYYVNNDTFGLRFFPPQLTRGLGPVRFPAEKAAGTYRIFILGESAAMGDPEPAYGPGRFLEALLSSRFPKTHFEIINTGITAIDSHVILPIARDCAHCDGNLWIIYMGNNEMVGPFGAATVFGAKTPPLALIRFNLAIQKTRLGQLVANLVRKMKSGNAGAPSWAGMEMFVGNQLEVDDPRREIVYQHFSRNLHDIVNAGLNSGAKVLLNTVAVNLKDCAPFASMINSNLTAVERAQFDQLFATGVQAENQSNFVEAAQLFAAAAKIDPNVAELHFRLGQSLLALTNLASAREQFQLAGDDDALPFRTDSRINGIIRSETKKTGDDDLVLFDASNTMAANTTSGLCGDETFYEHVHFNFDGSYQLGRAWAGQVAALLPAAIKNNAATNGWASQEDCDLRLGLSDWNRVYILQHMIGRLQQPPLSDQLGNSRRVEQLKEREEELYSRMDATKAGKTRADFLSVLKTSPSDYFLLGDYALFLQSIGDLPGATEEWQCIHELLPQDYLASFELGRLLELQSRWVEAELNFKRAVKLRHTLTEGWIELGNTLASQEQFEEALSSYAIAHQQRPQDAEILLRSGMMLAKLNRHAESIEDYRVAIKLNPADWEPHYQLGGELDSANQLSEACQEFAAAARLNPEYSRAHFNYGVLLGKLGRIDEARHEFDETIRLEPDNRKAHDYLAALPTGKSENP